jgi:trimethylamine--corrinoid protein Co-methyltransferase
MKRNLFDQNMRDDWVAAGGKDLTERAYENARYILGHHKPKPLPKGAAETMRSIVKNYEMELGITQT